jgi:hypothetical protein
VSDLSLNDLRLKQRLVIELSVFIAQSLMVFLVAVLMSDLLSDGRRLARVVVAKAASLSVREMVATALAFAVVMGLVALIRHMSTPNGALKRVFTELVMEIPRAMYFVGANLLGVAIAAGMYAASKPAERDVIPTLVSLALYGVVMFIYGFLARTFLTPGKIASKSREVRRGLE